MGRHFDKAVAVPAIHSQLRHMDIVRKRDRLDRLIADPRAFWCAVIPGRSGQSAHDESPADRHLKWQPIAPTREKVRHKLSQRDRLGSATTNLRTNSDRKRTRLNSS